MPIRAALDLAHGFRGEQLRPGDRGYDDARRVFNGAIDRQPALIARCTSAHDIAAVIALAREAGVPEAVHAGGQSVGGYAVCDRGVMVDLRPMKRIAVDAHACTARVEAGCTWGELDAARRTASPSPVGGCPALALPG